VSEICECPVVGISPVVDVSAIHERGREDRICRSRIGSGEISKSEGF